MAIGHGSQDPVISVEFSRQARPLLEQAGLDVIYRESPMAHGVDPGYLTELVRLDQRLPRQLMRSPPARGVAAACAPRDQEVGA